MTIIYRQCDDATRNKIALEPTKQIVKLEILSTSSNEYAQFATEVTTEVYFQAVQASCVSEVIEQL